MKKILVTGGSGFIGRNLIEQFAQLPAYAGKYEVLAPTHRELELADSEAVAVYFKTRSFDAIIHCAIKPGHRNAADLSGLFYRNTRMFFNLAKQEAAYGKLIWLSSGLAYGLNHYRPLMNEEYFGLHIPEDEAGFAKYVCAKYGEKTQNIIELRPFGVYGKYEDYAIRFISNAVCKTLCGLPVTIRQNRRFDYISADDLIRVIAHFIENPAKHAAYNVTSSAPAELAEIARMVVELGGAGNAVKIAESGLGSEYSGDNRRLTADMPDFKPTPLKRGIEQLFAYYSGHRDLINPELLKTDR